MQTPDKQKLDKLITCVSKLIRSFMQRHRPNLLPCIDPYYYIQKTEELKLIYDATVMNRMPCHNLITCYREVYCRWRKDALWFNKHILFNEPCYTLPADFPRSI